MFFLRAFGCWQQFYGLRFRGFRGAVDANIYYLIFENVLATAYQTIENVAAMAHVPIENVTIIYVYRERDHFDYDNRERDAQAFKTIVHVVLTLILLVLVVPDERQ